MFTALNIKNFKCFDDFSIDNLDRINLISGQNSVGKTALLEAIYLLMGTANPELILRINNFRGIREIAGDPSTIFDLLFGTLFHKLKHKPVTVIGRVHDGTTRQMNLQLESALPSKQLKFDDLFIDTEARSQEPIRLVQSHLGANNIKIESSVTINGTGIKVDGGLASQLEFRGHFISSRRIQSETENTNLFGRLVRQKEGYDQTLLEVLRLVENRLESITTLQIGEKSNIYADIGLNQLMPLSLLGDGMTKLASILLRISNSPGGIVLIDEIENGFHHSILENVWEAIGAAAKQFNTQIFATTHSYECIQAAHETFLKNGASDYFFRLHRLERIQRQIKAVSYNQETMNAAIDLELEVR